MAEPAPVEVKEPPASDTDIRRSFNELLGRQPSDKDLEWARAEGGSKLTDRIEALPEFKGVGNLERIIRIRFPDQAWLLNNPEVRDILLRAVHPDTEVDDQTFASQIRGTEWWKKTSASQREFQAQEAINPGEVNRRVAEKQFEIERLANRIGAVVPPPDIHGTARHAIYMGWSEDELTDYLFSRWVPEGATAGGTAYAALQQVRQMSKEYMVGMNEHFVRQAVGVARGSFSIDTIQREFAELAKAKFAGNEQLASMIDAGITPGAFFSEHRRLIAQEMEMDEDAVDLSAPKWQHVLSHAEGGVVRPMTLGETRKAVRSTAEWEGTTVGKATITEMGQGILQKMGVRANG